MGTEFCDRVILSRKKEETKRNQKKENNGENGEGKKREIKGKCIQG